MKRIAKPLLAVLFGVVWALVLVEIGARVLAAQGVIPSRMAQDIFAPHPVGWTFQPNLKATIPSATGLIKISINRDGFRDENYPRERTDATRVIVLGDSYVASIETPQEKTFHYLLEQSLGSSTEVITMGVSAYQPTQELLVYDTIGTDYQPDEVILMLYIGNDLLGNMPREDAPYYILNAEGDLEIQNYPWTGDFQMRAVFGTRSTWLMKTSEIAFLAGLFIEMGPQANARAQEQEGIAAPPNGDDTFLDGGNPAYCEFMSVANYSVIDDMNWAIDEALLLAMRDSATADGATFRVAIIPAEYQIQPDYEAAFLEACPRPATFDAPPLQDRLSEFFEANDIPYIDLRESMVAARDSTGEAMYLPGIDNHWTLAGHAAVADALHTWLDQE